MIGRLSTVSTRSTISTKVLDVGDWEAWESAPSRSAMGDGTDSHASSTLGGEFQWRCAYCYRSYTASDRDRFLAFAMLAVCRENHVICNTWLLAYTALMVGRPFMLSDLETDCVEASIPLPRTCVRAA